MKSSKTSLIRRYATVAVALVLVGVMFALARFPSLPAGDRARLAERFKFKPLPLPEVAHPPAYKYVREVHPSLKRISAWISSLGAGVTFADLDNDGLPNDLCSIDPRTDLVTIAPAPGTGARYSPFALNPAPLPYDARTTAPMGAVAGDFNEDGLMDLLVYYWGRTPVLFLRRMPPHGRAGLSAADFEPAELIGNGERWYTNGATQADLDGDGHVDLILGNYFQDGAHILDAHAGGVEVMHEGKAKALNGGRKHLFLFAGGTAGDHPTARFREITGVFNEEVERGWTLAIGAADLDGDLLPELYFGNDFGPDRLLHNRSKPGHLEFAVLEGVRTFGTPKSCVLGRDSFKGMGCDFADANGDGILDIYVSNIATQFGLTESHFLWLSTGDLESMKRGIAPYVHGSEKLGLSRSGWGWDSRLVDLDNDGTLEAMQAVGFVKGTINRWPELQALGTSNDRIVHDPRFWPSFKPGADLSGHDLNPFFVKAADGRYYDVGPEVGFTNSMVSKGIGIADVDGDGLLDFAFANQWEPSTFFHNESPHPGAFLALYLLLPTGAESPAGLTVQPSHPSPGYRGRSPINAMVRVHLADGRTLVNQVDGGTGHSGRRSPEVHFGLGAVESGRPLEVDLSWRDAKGQVQRAQLKLPPGWHTIWLGKSASSKTSERPLTP